MLRPEAWRIATDGCRRGKDAAVRAEKAVGGYRNGIRILFAILSSCRFAMLPSCRKESIRKKPSMTAGRFAGETRLTFRSYGHMGFESLQKKEAIYLARLPARTCYPRCSSLLGKRFTLKYHSCRRLSSGIPLFQCIWATGSSCPECNKRDLPCLARLSVAEITLGLIALESSIAVRELPYLGY